jgi:predicted dinucleotide-binding enzyme
MKKKLGGINVLYPTPTVLVGAMVDGKPNYITIAHIGIVNHARPYLISLSMGKTHYTNAGIKENKAFSVNIPSENSVVETDYVGLVSGKKTDKSKLFEIFFGKLEKTGQNARVAVVSEAATAAEVIVFATPWSVTEDAVQAAGNMAGKIVVDCTNPIAPDLKGLTIGTTTSAGEQVAQWARNARVVKAFNTTGSGNMANPLYETQPVTMFICGDDSEANETVAQLAKDAGFEPCVTGPLYHARYFEPMAMLWVDMAYLQGKGPDFAYKILAR